MPFNIAFLLYQGFEELDFAGPYEVFGAAARAIDKTWRLTTVAEERQVIGAHGLTIRVDRMLQDAPPAHVLVVPGGNATSALNSEPLVRFIRRAAAEAEYVASVCTGAFLLHRAGVLEGRRATTHWGAMERLKRLDGVTAVKERWVRDGNVVTAAGVSAGIDMALYVVGVLKGPAAARAVQLYMEYDPDLPYQDVPVDLPG